MTKVRLCAGCGVSPIAYGGRKYCYSCVPRVWKRPVCCKRCGSETDYFTAGLCRRCHRQGPLRNNCVDCFAWSVTRHHKWLCEACRSWHKRFGDSPRECRCCRRSLVCNRDRYCRLCWLQARAVRAPHAERDVIRANRDGQQLSFADMFRQRRWASAEPIAPINEPQRWPTGFPVAHRQLVLFEAPWILTPDHRYDVASSPVPVLAAALDRVGGEHAVVHGWSKTLRAMVCRGIHALLAVQNTPGSPIRTSELAVLSQLPNTTIQPVLEVLSAAGMLEEDRAPALEEWFERRTAGLAEPMRSEVRLWFCALRDGSTVAPRTRPRSIETVRHRVITVTDVLHAWSGAGHHSLREISREDIVAALPNDPDQRRRVLQSLRSLFAFLKGRRLVFTNPTARMRSPLPQPSYPMPMDLEILRDALNSPEPARAALAALVAFHALRTSQLRALQLADIRDGRLFLPDRTVPLAAPVREKLAAWLDERARRWPATVNPHVFISQYTAVRLGAVSGDWISGTNRVPAQAIREDRILHEALATHGDVRRLGDLFGLSVGAAERYAHTTDQS